MGVDGSDLFIVVEVVYVFVVGVDLECFGLVFVECYDLV